MRAEQASQLMDGAWAARLVAALVVFGALGSASARAGETIELQGRGAQVYRCDPASGGFAWRLTGPDATLFTPDGKEAGRHFAGPTWQADDGSSVVGEVVASSEGAAGAVPWLVLRAKSRTGSGVFGSVTYVVRSHTAGGVAPKDGCDSAHAGAEARVNYTATYTFFPAADPR